MGDGRGRGGLPCECSLLHMHMQLGTADHTLHLNHAFLPLSLTRTCAAVPRARNRRNADCANMVLDLQGFIASKHWLHAWAPLDRFSMI